MSDDAYKKAFERERAARKSAEALLEDKTREVYANYKKLERKNAELHAEKENLGLAHEKLVSAQKQLVHSEKMASLGLLSAGVAHEINNPIGFVLSNLETLQDYIRGYEHIIEAMMEVCDQFEQRAIVDKMLRVEDYEYVKMDMPLLLGESIAGLERVKDIVTSLNSFARTSDTEKRAVPINGLLESAVKVAWNELKYSAGVCYDFQSTNEALGSFGQLSQVFVNLIVNAAHAMRGQEHRGVLTLRTEDIDDKILIQVKDNGCGMSEETVEKVFDPFFTTKPMGVGTGLGLSVSIAIIEKHNGDLSVASKEGEGTCFSIAIPRSTD